MWKGTYDNPGQSQRCVLPKEEAISTKCCDEAQVLSTGLMLLLLPRPSLFLKENTGKSIKDMLGQKLWSIFPENRTEQQKSVLLSSCCFVISFDGYPLLQSCLENSMSRAWWAKVYGVANSQI